MKDVVWRKSTRSGQGADCVEVAVLPDRVLVRDSKDPDGTVLSFAYSEWRVFTGGVTDGEFDL
ncbi:MAG TPA: DUF397 domain-containing protein [Micromonosporaceae bacterium]